MSGAACVPSFDRYVGVDYSGAKTPTSSLKGLRVYAGNRSSPAVEIHPPPSPRKYWTRRGIAEWLVERFREPQATLVGIDHAFSFPRQYFDTHHLSGNWPDFLNDFQMHWPTDEDNIYVDFVRYGDHGNAAARSGNPSWRRLTDTRTRSAKSVFHFDVQGSVAKSTHAGIPWLLHVREQVGDRVHFWPFDGWEIPAERSAMVEVYPALWSHEFAPEGRTADQHDAYSSAEWMRWADADERLSRFLEPPADPEECALAEVEGWILGVK